MSILVNAFKVIFLLGFLVFIHEGGHFLAARFFKVKVEEFSVGFGHKIWTKKGKETTYSVGCIPFGGYVKMTGETERSEEEGAFNKAKISHRIIIVAAGAVVNIVFAVIVYFILGVVAENNMSTTISGIMDIAKENISVLQVGDDILQINNKKIRLKSDITKALENSNGENVDIIVKRNGEELEFSVKPTKYSEEYYILGITVELAEENIEKRLYYAFWETVDFTTSIGDSLKQLVTGNVKIEQMTGPIGISEIVVESKGIYNFIYLLCLVSLSLGITNLLPIPALDGGRILLLFIEGIRGKALKEEIELEIQSLGFLLLIVFSLYVSYKDILKIL